MNGGAASAVIGPGDARRERDLVAALTPASLTRGVGLLYGLVYLHYGAFAVFIPVWFAHRGFSPARIGILLSLPMLLRLLFVAPLTAWAGRNHALRIGILASSLCSAVIMACFPLVGSYVGFVAAFVVLALFWDPLPVLADSYAVLSVKARNLDFGRLRVWGSVAVVASSLASGWVVDRVGVWSVPFLTAGLLLGPLLLIFILPPDRLLGSSPARDKRGWRQLLGLRPLLVLVLASILVSASHTLVNNFGAVQWMAHGLSAGMVGILTAIGVGSEIATLWFAQSLLAGRSPVLMLVAAALASIVRWTLMAFDPGLPLLIVLQLLNGMSAMLAIAGLMLVIAERAPADLIAATQGIYAVLLGIALSGATAAAGLLWALLGPSAYAVMAGVAGLGLALMVWDMLRHRSRSSAIAQDAGV